MAQEAGMFRRARIDLFMRHPLLCLTLADVSAHSSNVHGSATTSKWPPAIRSRGKVKVAMPASTQFPNPEPVWHSRNPLKTCPDCHSEVIVWLVQMRQHDESRDYYRCKECGNEFALERPA